MTPCGQCGFWGPGRGWRHALRGFAAASTCNWGRCMENYINVEWCWYFLRIWMLLLLLRSCGKTSQADSWNPAGFGTTLNRSVGVSGKQQSVLSPVAKAWHCNHCNCCGTKTLVCWTGGATPEINDVSFSFCYVTMSIQNSIFFLARSSYSKNSERSLEGRWEKNWTSMDLWDKLKLTFFSCGILPWDFHEAYETFPFGYTDLGMTEKDMLRKEVGPRWQWRVENLWGGVMAPKFLLCGVLAAWKSYGDIRNIQKLWRERGLIFDPYSQYINRVGVATMQWTQAMAKLRRVKSAWRLKRFQGYQLSTHNQQNFCFIPFAAIGSGQFMAENYEMDCGHIFAILCQIW